MVLVFAWSTWLALGVVLFVAVDSPLALLSDGEKKEEVLASIWVVLEENWSVLGKSWAVLEVVLRPALTLTRVVLEEDSGSDTVPLEGSFGSTGINARLYNKPKGRIEMVEYKLQYINFFSPLVAHFLIVAMNNVTDVYYTFSYSGLL